MYLFNNNVTVQNDGVGVCDLSCSSEAWWKEEACT